MALKSDAGQVRAAIENVFGGNNVMAHFVVCFGSFSKLAYTFEMLPEIFVAHLDRKEQVRYHDTVDKPREMMIPTRILSLMRLFLYPLSSVSKRIVSALL